VSARPLHIHSRKQPPFTLAGGEEGGHTRFLLVSRAHGTVLNRKNSSSEKLNVAAAFVFATAMYITVTVPSIRSVVTPLEGVDTYEDQIYALRVLSAGNTLIMVLLGGVLALQVRERRSYHFILGFLFVVVGSKSGGIRKPFRILIFSSFRSINFTYFVGFYRAVKNGLGDWN
jgi:hypothetical protein